MAETQPRPVVDAANEVVNNAATETRTSRIIAAVAGVLGAVPAFLIAFEFIIWDAVRVAQYGTMLGLFVALALVIAGERTKANARVAAANALVVEAQVTPIASPQLTKIVPLKPE